MKVKKQTLKRNIRVFFVVGIAISISLFFGVVARPLYAAESIREIVFPVIGSVRFSNDFGAPRVGHTHQGNDIIGTKGQPLVAAVDGVVQWVLSPVTGNTLGVSIVNDDGYAYWYIHVNNDTPGTDDGTSRGIFAYAPDIDDGLPVVAGQLIGWMGDSGNAESTVPHLHFEIHTPEGGVINPYQSLTAARHVSTPTNGPVLSNEILPYGQFTGGSSVALGNVYMKNPGNEIVTGAGPGGGPHVKVYSKAGKRLSQFFAFEDSFRGGVDVAVSDYNGDGTDEIIVSSGRGRVTEVRIFTYKGVLLDSFQAYATSFIGGANVAAADLTGDGKAEIITAPLRGGGPHVRIFKGGDHKPWKQFFPYAASFRGGVDVSAYQATTTTPPLIAVSPMHGGGPDFRLYNAKTLAVYKRFLGGDPVSRHGLRISLANIDDTTDQPEVAMTAENANGPWVEVFSLRGKKLSHYTFFESWWEGGYDVAAETGGLLVSSLGKYETTRRATVRWVYGPAN